MLLPVKVNVPGPLLINAFAVAPLEISPSKVRPVKADPLTVIVRDVPAADPRVMAPMPKFSAWVPPKVKLPLMATGLLLASVTGADDVLLIVPPLMVKAPTLPPNAVALLMFNVGVPVAPNVVPPV